MGIGPSSSYEGTMPAKDRLGREEEGRPPFTRDEASEDTDDCSIRPGEARTSGLAAEHGELMAECEDLGVLGYLFHPVDADRLEDAVDEAVEKGERHSC
jgi:hypothetical protein